MTRLVVATRSILKSYLDCYILPGTTAGTEIAWLYLNHWWKDLATLCFLVSAFRDSSGKDDSSLPC